MAIKTLVLVLGDAAKSLCDEAALSRRMMLKEPCDSVAWHRHSGEDFAFRLAARRITAMDHPGHDPQAILDLVNQTTDEYYNEWSR